MTRPLVSVALAYVGGLLPGDWRQRPWWVLCAVSLGVPARQLFGERDVDGWFGLWLCWLVGPTWFAEPRSSRRTICVRLNASPSRKLRYAVSWGGQISN